MPTGEGRGSHARDSWQAGEGALPSGSEGHSWSSPPSKPSALPLREVAEITSATQAGSQLQQGGNAGGTAVDTCQVHAPLLTQEAQVSFMVHMGAAEAIRAL